MSDHRDPATDQPWEPEPNEQGYYWMRWRVKWGRRWMYDVVYTSSVVGRNSIRTWKGWTPISEYPKAMFYGPIHPPGTTP